MLIRPAANAVSLEREELVEHCVDIRAFGFHRGPVGRTGMVEVDIDREPVESEAKEVERRPALQCRTIRRNPIPLSLLQQVRVSRHLLQRAGLVTGLVRMTLQVLLPGAIRPSGWGQLSARVA